MDLLATLKLLLIVCGGLAIVVLGGIAGMAAKTKKYEGRSCVSVFGACTLGLCLTGANPQGSIAFAAGIGAAGYFVGWLFGLAMFPPLD